MKKRVLSVFLLFSMINFVSAQGLSDIFEQIDQPTLILYSVFILSFTLLFFSVNKFVLRGDKAMSGIVSGILAFLLTYWVNKSGLNIEEFLYDFGISESNLSLIISLVIIAAVVYVIIKFQKDSLFILGGLLILASFFVYAKTLLIAIGIILIVIRLFIKGKKEDDYIKKWKKYLKRK